MVNKVCVFLLAAFVGVVVLGIGCNAVTFRVRSQRRALTLAALDQIMTAIADLVNSIDVEGLYYAGTTFTRDFTSTIVFDDVQVVVRLSFYNRVHSLSGFCSLNPVWSQVMRGRRLFESFTEMFGPVRATARGGLFGHLLGDAGSLGIEYFIRRPDDETTHSFTSLGSNNTMMFKPQEEHQNVSFHLDDDDEPACWVYSTCLVSGENAALGSYLPGGATLVSGNGLYKLIMQNDCNLVHYDVSGEEYVAKWASDTKDRDEGCYVNLQMDGNLVLVGSSGIHVLWSTDRYCQPQPNCIMSAALVVQDDGNLVIYNTDQRKPIWSIF